MRHDIYLLGDVCLILDHRQLRRAQLARQSVEPQKLRLQTRFRFLSQRLRRFARIIVVDREDAHHEHAVFFLKLQCLHTLTNVEGNLVAVDRRIFLELRYLGTNADRIKRLHVWRLHIRMDLREKKDLAIFRTGSIHCTLGKLAANVHSDRCVWQRHKLAQRHHHSTFASNCTHRITSLLKKALQREPCKAFHLIPCIPAAVRQRQGSHPW